MGARTSPSNLSVNSYPSCAVCGSGGARYHYHGLVCQSCRVFFIRTVGQNKPLICNRGGSCSTVLGNSCNACAACRFKRCLEAKMDCAAVGRKKKPSTCVSSVITNKNRMWKDQLRDTLQLPTSNWIQAVSGVDTISDLAFQFVKLEMEINHLDNPTTSRTGSEAGIPASPPIFKLGWNSESRLTRQHPPEYYHQAAREFMENLDFCPEIKAMDAKDKAILVEHNYQEMGLLSYKYYSWVAKNFSSSAFMTVASNNCRPMWSESAEEIFENSHITDGEFVLLKIICLLSSVQNLSQEGHWYAVLARTRFMMLLSELSKKLSPELISLRVSSLLEIIAKVKEQMTFETRNMVNVDIHRLAQAMRTHSKSLDSA